MASNLFHDLMMSSTIGHPSFSLWALASAFGLCGFGFAIWTAGTRNANKKWYGSWVDLLSGAGPTPTISTSMARMNPIPPLIAGMKTAKAKAAAAKVVIGVVVFGFLTFGLGWLLRDHQERANSEEILNAVVESQTGLRFVYHYMDDPTKEQHAQVICAEPSERVPHFKPGQIIRKMELARDTDCERVKLLDLRRSNGEAILAGGY